MHSSFPIIFHCFLLSLTSKSVLSVCFRISFSLFPTNQDAFFIHYSSVEGEQLIGFKIKLVISLQGSGIYNCEESHLGQNRKSLRHSSMKGWCETSKGKRMKNLSQFWHSTFHTRFYSCNAHTISGSISVTIIACSLDSFPYLSKALILCCFFGRNKKINLL